MVKKRITGITLEDGVNVASWLAKVALTILGPSLQNTDYTDKRLELQREFFSKLSDSQLTKPERHSLVGYFVVKSTTPGARDFIDKARERVKEYIKAGDVIEIEFEEFKKKYGLELDAFPSLVIWSTETKGPLLIIPFYKGRGKKAMPEPAIEEVATSLAEELEESKEPVLAEI